MFLMCAVIAVFNSLKVRHTIAHFNGNFDTDNQIRLP